MSRTQGTYLNLGIYKVVLSRGALGVCFKLSGISWMLSLKWDIPKNDCLNRLGHLLSATSSLTLATDAGKISLSKVELDVCFHLQLFAIHNAPLSARTFFTCNYHSSKRTCKFPLSLPGIRFPGVYQCSKQAWIFEFGLRCNHNSNVLVGTGHSGNIDIQNGPGHLLNPFSHLYHLEWPLWFETFSIVVPQASRHPLPFSAIFYNLIVL